MNGKIALITILTEDVRRLADFYHYVLGFQILQDLGKYVELENPGVRFAICARTVMHEATGHTDFQEPRSGQSFELAFPLNSASEVDLVYESIIHQGASPIQPPENMPWKQHTAFFADPDGNIHELFANLD